MGVNEARRLKELEEENRRLKKIVADQALDVSALKEALHRKWCCKGRANHSSARRMVGGNVLAGESHPNGWGFTR
jgi:hypothetical protein